MESIISFLYGLILSYILQEVYHLSILKIVAIVVISWTILYSIVLLLRHQYK